MAFSLRKLWNRWSSGGLFGARSPEEETRAKKIRQLRALERQFRRPAFIEVGRRQAMIHKHNLIMKGKGRNGLSMSAELLSKHGIQLKAQPQQALES